MSKQIFFYIDQYIYEGHYPSECYFAKDYERTQKLINEDRSIVTTSIAHLSYDLINKEYEVFLCYKDKRVKVEDGMELTESGYCLSEPHYYEDADILNCFKSGYFDKFLGIKEGEL